MGEANEQCIQGLPSKKDAEILLSAFCLCCPHKTFISVFSQQLCRHYIYLASVRVFRLALKFHSTRVMSQSCKCDAVFVFAHRTNPLKRGMLVN